MDKSIEKNSMRKIRRASRVRGHVRGTPQKPRLCVVKTNKHIQVQLIDDEAGVTLASISTNSKELQKTPFCKKNKASAKVLGEKIAERAKTLGIEKVVYDRGPFKFHGRLEAVAAGARESGLQF